MGVSTRSATRCWGIAQLIRDDQRALCVRAVWCSIERPGCYAVAHALIRYDGHLNHRAARRDPRSPQPRDHHYSEKVVQYNSVPYYLRAVEIYQLVP